MSFPPRIPANSRQTGQFPPNGSKRFPPLSRARETYSPIGGFLRFWRELAGALFPAKDSRQTDRHPCCACLSVWRESGLTEEELWCLLRCQKRS